MGKYVKLLISKEQVEEAIIEFGRSRSSNFNLIPPKIMNSATGQTRYNIKLDSDSFDIDFYFRTTDNKTTIKEIGNETNKSLCIELAEYIFNKLEYSEIQQGTFTIKTTNEIYNKIIDYLSSIEGVKVVKNEDDNIKIIKQFLSEIGDKITLTYYKGSGKLVYQGCFFKLYSEVKCFLNPLGLNSETIINEKALDKDGVDLLVNKSIPDAYNSIDSNLKDYLYDSFVHIKNRVQCKDYSVWTFSALKGLEAFIKQLLLKNGTMLNDNAGFTLLNTSTGKLEPIFKKDSNGIYQLDITLVVPKSDMYRVALGDTYDYFNKNRHVLFHTKQLIQTTRKIANSSDAEVIIYKVCDLFNKYYQLLV